MMPNNTNTTYAAASEMLKPDNPIPVGHLEAIDIAKAVMGTSINSLLSFLRPVRAGMTIFRGARMFFTGEVFDISYGSTARNIP